MPVALVFILLRNVLFCSTAEADCGIGHAAGNCCLSHLEGGLFQGWNWKVCLVLGVQIVNNYVVGMVYKKVNALAKCFAYAQSVWIVYIWGLDRWGDINLDILMVIIVLV